MFPQYFFETSKKAMKHLEQGLEFPTLKELEFHFINSDRILMILKVGEKTIATEMTPETAKKIELDVKKFRDRYSEFLAKED